MKARLGFAIATAIEPEILIADEVLSTGDDALRKKCEARMHKLLSDGTTLLFVSHFSGAVKHLCKKVLWLDSGEARMRGETGDVMKAYEAFAAQPGK